MSVETLAARAKVLQGVVQEASQNVNSLSQQLQQATIHLHTVSGHLNEVAYLLSEAQKEAGLIPAEALEEHAKCKEQQDGQVDGEGSEQAAQE